MFRILVMAAVLARAGEVAAVGEGAPPLDDLAEAPAAADEYGFDDPNDNRLMFAPNGR